MGLYYYTNSSYQTYSFLRHFCLLTTSYIILNITPAVNYFQCLFSFGKSVKKWLYQINCVIQYSRLIIISWGVCFHLNFLSTYYIKPYPQKNRKKIRHTRLLHPICLIINPPTLPLLPHQLKYVLFCCLLIPSLPLSSNLLFRSMKASAVFLLSSSLTF